MAYATYVSLAHSLVSAAAVRRLLGHV